MWVVFSGVVTNICNAKFGRERQESGVGYQILWNWKRLPLVALAILQMFTHLSQQPFQQICPLEGSEGPFFPIWNFVWLNVVVPWGYGAVGGVLIQHAHSPGFDPQHLVKVIVVPTVIPELLTLRRWFGYTSKKDSTCDSCSDNLEPQATVLNKHGFV